MLWPNDIEQKFKDMVEKIPLFLRGIAKDKVAKKAEALAAKEGRGEISEKDLVDAFFAETPFGFHGPMKNDMKDLGIEYTQYGHPE